MANSTKSFWRRPEGILGGVVLAGLVVGGGFLFMSVLPALVAMVQNTVYLAGMLLALAAIIYLVLDPKFRGLVGYMYKSVMRWITGLFVNIDPIGILKSYIEDLEDNLRKMSKQIGALRGQSRKLETIMDQNKKEIEYNMRIASKAKQKGNIKQMMLSTRKAARLKDSNAKYHKLWSKIDVMHKILTKMYSNSEILLEDTRDQVKMKEQERAAIRASHGAMKSAMSVISGDPDKRAMFDAAMEAVADDVANKVGEMERFMDMSANFMDSVDLKNGLFEEEGLKMLEKFEKESTLMLMGSMQPSDDLLDLNVDHATPTPMKVERSNDDSGYENLFN